MRAFSGENIEYNEKLIDQDTLRLWTSLTVPKSLKQVEPEDVVWLSDIMNSAEFLNNDVVPFYDDSAVKAAVKEAIDYIKSDAEYTQLLLSESGWSDDRLYQEAYEDVKTSLLSPIVDEKIADTNFSILDHIKLSTNEAGIFECQIEGDALLKADTKTLAGKNVKYILQIAIVFLDIITIIMTAAGILAEKGKEFAKRFVNSVSKIEGWFMEMMERLWAELKPLIDKVRPFKKSGESAKWVSVVKEAAKEIAKAIAAVISWAKKAKKFEALKSACKSAIRLMFNSGWKKFIALCQLIASLILLVVSGGTSLILKIINLVAGLVSLVLDSIDLYDMMHKSA